MHSFSIKATVAAASIAAATLLGLHQASAATFDFAAIADAYRALSGSGTEEGDFAQVNSQLPGSFIGGDGVSITSITSPGGQHPFFDGDTAGLGVCSSGYTATASFSGVGSISDCSTWKGSSTGDDNLQSGEMFTLVFNQLVDLSGLFFRNATHGLLNGAVNIAGGDFTVTNGLITAGNTSLLSGNSSVTFAFASTGGQEYYLSAATAIAAIPVPAAGLLLLGALGTLGALHRRRRKPA